MSTTRDENKTLHQVFKERRERTEVVQKQLPLPEL
jgi:hypothetical protein